MDKLTLFVVNLLLRIIWKKYTIYYFYMVYFVSKTFNLKLIILETKKIFFSIILLFALFSCQKKQKSSVKIIEIPKFQNKKSDEAETIIDSTFVIPLKISNKVVLSHIEKVELYNDNIYVLDSRGAKGVFQFDMNGKFVRQIGSRGKGPKQYIIPTSFVLDKKKNNIMIHDTARNSLLVYNLENYDFAESIKLDVELSDFEIMNDGFVASIHNIPQKKDKERKFSLSYLDEKGHIISNNLQAKHKIGNLHSTTCLSGTLNNYYFHEPHSNLIYKIVEIENKLEVDLAFEVKFEDKGIPKSMFENSKKIKDVIGFFQEINDKRYANVRYAVVHNEKITLPVRIGNDLSLYIYSVKTGNLYNLDNHVGIGYVELLKTSQNVGFYKDFQISYTQPDWLKEIQKSVKSKKAIELINSLNINDNPILVFSRYKNSI